MAKKKSDGPTDILASAAMPNPVSGVMPQSPRSEERRVGKEC
jgi:hypothetical protein